MAKIKNMQNALGYFCKLTEILYKSEVAQRDGDILGYFLPRQFCYIFNKGKVTKHGLF
jgi:hypothetical protein